MDSERSEGGRRNWMVCFVARLVHESKVTAPCSEVARTVTRLPQVDGAPPRFVTVAVDLPLLASPDALRLELKI